MALCPRMSADVAAKASTPIIMVRITIFPFFIGGYSLVWSVQAIGTTGTAALIISAATQTEATSEMAKRWAVSKWIDMIFFPFLWRFGPSERRCQGNCRDHANSVTNGIATII